MTRLRRALRNLDDGVLDALLGKVDYRRPPTLAQRIDPYMPRPTAPAGLRPWST